MGRDGRRSTTFQRRNGQTQEKRQSPAAISSGRLGFGLEVLAELAEGVRICLAAPDGFAEESHGGKALWHHLLFLDHRQGRKDFPLGFSIPSEGQESLRDY